MKIAFEILAIFLCLSCITFAFPENCITGPYNVSFDMGLISGINTISIDKPVDSETINGISKTDYQINIRSNDPTSWASIQITKYYDQNPQPHVNRPEDVLRSIMQNNYPGKNVQVAARVIDGSDGATGFITSGQYMLFNAAYFATFDPTVVVYIQSTYPWDEGTLKLLKTIHVEKAN